MTSASATSETVDTSTELTCALPVDSRIKIIGLGGVGCIVLQYLSLFLASLRIPIRLVLVDGDDFEAKNAHRMHFTSLANKAELKATETLESLGTGDVAIVAVPEYVSEDNIGALIRPADHLLVCVDNHQTRRLIAEHCAGLDDVVLISGGNDGVEPPEMRGTYGNVQIHIRRDGKDLTHPITRFHPEVANATGDLPTDANCVQMAKSSPQILFANLATASHMLNAFFAYCCCELSYQEVTFDIIEAKSQPLFRLQRGTIPSPVVPLH